MKDNGKAYFFKVSAANAKKKADARKARNQYGQYVDTKDTIKKGEKDENK